MTAARELEQVADWLPLLHLMRTSRPPQAQVGPRPAPGSRPPLNVDAVDLIERVHATLASWVQLAMEEGLTSDDWPADNTLAVCLWLARNAHLMDEHMAGDEFAAEVHDLWKRVRNAVGERPPREMHHACTQCGNPSVLVNEGDLWACPECGREDPGPRALIDEFRHAPSQPTPDICERFGVSSQWLADQKRRRGLKADESKGKFPRHWWPWDVFRLLHPGLVDLWERHAEEVSLRRSG